MMSDDKSPRVIDLGEALKNSVKREPVTADSDRIAQLTAELDAKHAKLVEVADKMRDERAAHERTKAELGADLREAREVAQRNAQDCSHLRRSAITLTAERDAAQAERYAEWGWHMLTAVYAASVYNLIVMRNGIDWIAILTMSEKNRKRAEAMREALEGVIEENGKSILHSGYAAETHWVPCPQDDTCDCELAAMVKAALDDKEPA